ncbi:MAG: hypothetical protein ABR581_05910 [Thermoleophilaceae bacterium]
MARIVPVPLAVLALLAAGGTSQAAPAHPSDPVAWATVNVCDTPAAPGQVGMRVGVRGDGRDRRAFARFTAQWYSSARSGWQPVAGTSRSPWVRVGSTIFASRQNGWTFGFEPPRQDSFIVRGLVQLQWRARGRVVREATLVTRRGLPGVDEADPAGSSRASCTLG